MQRLSTKEFEHCLDDYNASVEQTCGIAAFATSSHWAWAAHQVLHEPRELVVYRDSDAWVALTAGELFGYSRVLQPLEAFWSFACPLVGNDTKRVVELLRSILIRMGSDYPLIYLGGIPEHGVLHSVLRRCLGGAYRVVSIPGCHCLQASLDGGLDGFLSRRSGKFRAELKRSKRRVLEQGISVEHLNKDLSGDELFERVLAVEASTWKWQQGESIFQGDAARFYQQMMVLAADRGCLRAVFFQHEGQDVAYAFGAVFAGVFRGLQMGYDQSLAQFGLGNLAQWELVEQSVSEALEWYDLGMVMDYKLRWADRQLNLVNLLIVRN